MSQEKVQEIKHWVQSQVPIKRFGTPEEIAAGVLYLTAPDPLSSWAQNSSSTAVWRRFDRFTRSGMSYLLFRSEGFMILASS
jgi:NAD(P)-dependent dehydrogenase (short-subunit alcohol dehydrogenase family)